MQANQIKGTLGAADQSVTLGLPGLGGVAIQVTGTFVGTITFECSVDGVNFRSLLVTPSSSTTQVTTATSVGLWFGNAAGLNLVRARMSAYTSGAASVTLKAVTASPGGGSSGGGGGGGTSSTFGDPFPADGTAAGFIASDGTMAGGTLDASGFLKVNVAAGGASGGTSSTFGAAFPATGTAIGVSDPDGTMGALAAETLDYDTGGATVSQTVMGLALPGAGGPVAGGTATNPVRTDPTGTTTQPVSAASLPLPTGAATLAEQQAQTTALQILDDWDESDRAKVNLIVGEAGIAAGAGVVGVTVPRVTLASDDPAVASLAIIDANTDSGAVVGNGAAATAQRVTLANDSTGIVALTTSTASIGKLAANSGVDIGDVDVTTVVPGTGATNLGKAEDAAHSSGDVGVMALGVNDDTPAALSGADGRYEPFQVSAGRAWTWAGGKNTYSAKGTITVTLTSLANGSGRESTVVDFTTTRYKDARIRFQTKGQASGTAYLDVYVYTALGDTTYTDLATGSDAAFTAANRFNSRYLGSIKCNAATTAVCGEMQLSDVFPTCPNKWGLIFINNTGAAMSATAGDHVIEYEGIY